MRAFGRLPGVDRPALATIIPTRRNPAVLLDSGATVECRPQHLVQFAVMGSAYARVALGCESPRVGLLSVGEEESKGNELTREAHQLLKSAPVRFVGNVEGRDVYSGEADVIVCDGFTGNVTLKISEGLVETVERLLHEELSATVGTRVGYLLSREAFRRFRKRVDYAEYGGAPLIGLDGLCVIGHGRSSAKAVRSAIMMTAKLVDEQLLDRLTQEVAAVGCEPTNRELRTPNPEPRTPNHEPRASMIAFVFPGQGAQKVGMGKALAEAFPICRQTFDEADEALGESLSGLCFDGPESQLLLTENAQPAILAVSVAAARLGRVARCDRDLRRRAQPRGVLGARRSRHAVLRGRAADRPAPRAVHAGSRACWRGRHVSDSRATMPSSSAQACAERAPSLPAASCRRPT